MTDLPRWEMSISPAEAVWIETNEISNIQAIHCEDCYRRAYSTPLALTGCAQAQADNSQLERS